MELVEIIIKQHIIILKNKYKKITSIYLQMGACQSRIIIYKNNKTSKKGKQLLLQPNFKYFSIGEDSENSLFQEEDKQLMYCQIE